MQKFLENLEQAEKQIRIADHMTYVTFPLIQDKKILLKILTETKTATAKIINAILQYEYIYKRITLYKDPKSNFKTFQEKCAPKYNITQQETKLITVLFDLAKKHEQSPMEFMKDKKIIILTEDSEPHTITIEKIKEFVQLSKDILEKTQKTVLSKI